MNYRWHHNALLKAVRFKTFDELVKENNSEAHPNEQSLFGKKTQEGDIKIDKNGKQKIYRNGRWRSLDDGTKKLVEANKNKATADVEWKRQDKQQAARWKRNTLRSHPKLFEFSKKTVTFGSVPRIDTGIKPKEGDTKPGANGHTLTLKNHRWRLSENDEYDRYEHILDYKKVSGQAPYSDDVRNLYHEYNRAISNSPVTIDDWHINTKVDFDPIDEESYESLDAPEYYSGSSSAYKVKDGNVYRASNHWGQFATVNWGLKDNNDAVDRPISYGRTMQWSDAVKYGKAKLSDFVRISGDSTINGRVNDARKEKLGDKYRETSKISKKAQSIYENIKDDKDFQDTIRGIVDIYHGTVTTAYGGDKIYKNPVRGRASATNSIVDYLTDDFYKKPIIADKDKAFDIARDIVKILLNHGNH